MIPYTRKRFPAFLYIVSMDTCLIELLTQQNLLTATLSAFSSLNSRQCFVRSRQFLMLGRISILIFTNKLFLLSFLSIFYKRNRKTRRVISSSYNGTWGVERTLEKLVKHSAIVSCFTSFSRVHSTPSCRNYNSIKSWGLAS